ncbi:MAG: hypothetical protein RMZ41_005820 [Nostoc sp. DedVER02]|uniref:hypothetical protein n=1 Tax=unclassified Nostoc TaxID=2593658 RepID=UPI002AD45E62|nr:MULTISPECIES: hypothetical protein [unclassified Nostoc]MDZ7990184.1 hypothetical protein [Nostoc sp. DedVER02]MDZ8111924.1 hypothetical protein [Nostoc sp. DedVER01b]
MLSGIRTSINLSSPAERLRSVVLLTDGYIGNENEISSTHLWAVRGHQRDWLG